ncbi:hypothetical protein HYR99_13115 [Candidatus Poribacteria bacterium]|nr:hypothetical protein [Candidatus Poribacteria bacterium]
MPRCNLAEAVEDAAFEYLKGLLINRLLRLLGRRVTIVLGLLAAVTLVDNLLPFGALIGFALSIGVGIWIFGEVFVTIKRTIDQYKRGAWRSFRNLPQRILRELDPSFFNCLDGKTECCDLFNRQVGSKLLEWVKGLQPGWKQKSAWDAGVKFKKVKNDIKQQIIEPLRKCCQ